MTKLDAHGAATGTGDRSRPRAVLPALCATQITSWGVIYYAFPVLNPAITADTGWPTGATTAAFSAALLISAFAGIRVGRMIDHRGPRTVMTAGSVLGVASLLIIAAAPNLPVFFTGWLLAGLAMAATFYQPAFAALTRWWAPDHVRALTVVTLAGGLASTVFAPLTAMLADRLTWRATYAVLTLILATVTVPAHALALRAPWPEAPPATAHAGESATAVSRSRPFWMLATALTLSAFTVYAVVVALVPLLLERGYSTSQAAWALGLGGAGQTLGRTLYATLARHTRIIARTTTLIALGGVTKPPSPSHPAPTPCWSPCRSRPGWFAATSPCYKRPPSPTAGAPPTTAACPDSSQHLRPRPQRSPRSPARRWPHHSVAIQSSSLCSPRFPHLRR